MATRFPIGTWYDTDAYCPNEAPYRVLSRIFCLGGESILKKVLSHAVVRKEFFRPSGGSRGMLPQKILKI